MNTKPDCPPDEPENGQENAATFDSESLHYLITAAENAESLVRMAWNAYYAAKYNDTRRALYNLNEARIYTQCVQKKLALLPPTEDSPENEQ